MTVLQAPRKARRTGKANDPAKVERRRQFKSGLPDEPDLTQPLPKRLLRNPLAWLTLIMLLVYATLLAMTYQQVVPDERTAQGIIPGIGVEAIPIAAKYAAITVIPLSLLFLWADRFRPQRFWVWLMTFGWGAAVATWVSLQINTWASAHLSIVGSGDPATASRAAIYVAPFVEEASKATVLFWLVILMRYQWVSRLSGIVLAGLSGAAFAFTENVLYYGRVYRYAARTFGEVPPLEALQGLFVQRGLMTFFGHPLFTSMTGIGLAVAVRSKSKIVRIVAPLAGYCGAAFLHMSFNATASLVSGQNLLFVYLFVAVPLVLAMVGFVIRQLFREGRIVRERLIDYVRVGWLPDTDPEPLSRLRTRLRALWHALFLGPRRFADTIRFQRAATELAYLRDAMARGIVDDAGLAREKVLLAKIRTLRPSAVVQPTGRAGYPWDRRRSRPPTALTAYPPPSFPGPAGLGGNFPAPPNSGPNSGPNPVPTAVPTGAVPGALGQTGAQYSEVDPRWKPPGE